MHARVSEMEKTATRSLCVCVRQSICMLSSSQSSRALIIHIELLKTCHVLIIKHISSTKCSFEEHPNSSRKEDHEMRGSLLGNKRD